MTGSPLHTHRVGLIPGLRDDAMRDQISELTTNRLSLYVRFLSELDEKGVTTVSSQVLADQFGLNAALIRKDLAHFGDLGVRGVGYVVKDLRRELRSILGLDRPLRVAIMGAGNLGLALADYPGFRRDGFRIVALFDNQAREGRPPVAQRRSDLPCRRAADGWRGGRPSRSP